ncbi:MAG: FliA/WhiG family RNA polymerase sigma factor [Planctomycetota bacterium]|nr:FliA/WhiG family RNA polymerase sigma factor [Planctomycetota bacterium]
MERPSQPRTRPTSRTSTPGLARRGRSNQGRPRASIETSYSKPGPKRERAPLRPTPEPDQSSVTELWKRYREARERGDEANTARSRNELVEHYLPLVKSAAERLLRTLPSSVELDDLMSAGLFGLMDAIGRFEPTRGIQFSTFCGHRIRGAFLDQLRSEDWVPRLVRRRASSIAKERQRFAMLNGREPSHLELADELDMDETKFWREIQNADISTVTSLSARLGGDDGDTEMSEVVSSPRSQEPLMAVGRSDMFDQLTGSVSPRERVILIEYYERGRTLREIGEMLGLTESRISQIHSNAMDSLRLQLGEKQSTLLM